MVERGVRKVSDVIIFFAHLKQIKTLLFFPSFLLIFCTVYRNDYLKERTRNIYMKQMLRLVYAKFVYPPTGIELQALYRGNRLRQIKA